MKHRLSKYGYLLVCSVFLILIGLVGFFLSGNGTFRVLIKSDSQSAIIYPYEENGKYHLFLPAYCDLSQASFEVTAREPISIEGVALEKRDTLEWVEFNKTYSLTIAGVRYPLEFHKSENVATLYIDTLSGSMEQIHEDKNYQETASMVLYTSDGTVNHSDLACTLKGRGNATWGYEKRPYLLTLAKDGDLMGMGAATDWVLLANATDESNLRNALVFDLAQQVSGLWVPQYQYVDLYLNGSYNGLYLLTEQVEVGQSRLDIDPDNGDFLCKVDLLARWNYLDQPFLSQAGRTISLAEPKTADISEQQKIIQLVNQMEQGLLSDTASQFPAYIDLDSWVCRYLIDEISGNIDADLASSYFYYSDGVFYAGPVWDYDMTFGNCYRNQNAFSFYAKTRLKSSSVSSVYYSHLYKNEVFYQRILDIYRTKFAPALEELLSTGLQASADFLSAAAGMNSLRWQTMFDTMPQLEHPVFPTSPEQLAEYLQIRVDLLNSAWIDQVDYCTVQMDVQKGDYYWITAVKQGEYLDTPYLQMENTIWIDTRTGEPFDSSQPVTEDLILHQQPLIQSPTPQTPAVEEVPASAEEPEEPAGPEPIGKTTIAVWFSLLVFLLLFLIFLFTDRKQRMQEKRKERSHIG